MSVFNLADAGPTVDQLVTLLADVAPGAQLVYRIRAENADEMQWDEARKAWTDPTRAVIDANGETLGAGSDAETAIIRALRRVFLQREAEQLRWQAAVEDYQAAHHALLSLKVKP